ncbi:MAG: hypothetical protein LBN95_04920 [Prevotellaceae bacterium]|jgi:uncharacterized GH25 family protein|nr:hypothetical protein [Prevotellaceae bacterium]
MKKIFVLLAVIACISVSCKKAENISVTNMCIENHTFYTVGIDFMASNFDASKSDTSFYFKIMPEDKKLVFSLMSIPYYSRLEHPDVYDSAKIYVNSKVYTQYGGNGVLKMNNYVEQPEKTYKDGNYTYYERILVIDDNFLEELENNNK